MVVFFALSFDDGVKSDVLLARILEDYRLKASFFITVGKLGFSSLWLSKDDALWLSEVHEVASHTLTHPCLTNVSEEALAKELENSKVILERVVGKNVVGFAYPYGVFDKRVRKCVRRVGYAYARSTMPFWVGSYGCRIDVYVLPVTLPLYPIKLIGSIHDVIGKLKRVFLRVLIDMGVEDLKSFLQGLFRRDYIDVFQFARDVLTVLVELTGTTKKSYVVSFWGHSWELVLDRDTRSKFEDFLAYVSSLRRYVRVLTLRELIEEGVVRGL